MKATELVDRLRPVHESDLPNTVKYLFTYLHNLGAEDFGEHEESFYAVQWASNDPWLLASLSYDGRLILNRVLKNEKFQIFLRGPS